MKFILLKKYLQIYYAYLDKTQILFSKLGLGGCKMKIKILCILIFSIFMIRIPVHAISLAEHTKPLSLDDAILKAKQNSYLIKIADSNNKILSLNVIRAKSQFDYYINADTFIMDERTPVPSILFGPADVGAQQKNIGATFNLQKAFKTGAILQAGVSNVRNHTNNIFYTINPNISSSVDLQIMQPLLAGAGRDISTANLFIASQLSESANNQFNKEYKNILMDTISIYWQLYLLYNQLEVSEATLKWVDKLFSDTEAMVQEGMLSQLDLKQINAEKERQTYLHQTIINSYIEVESTLKLLLAENIDNFLYIPTSEPSIEINLPNNFEELIKIAFNQREEILALEHQRKAIEREYKVATNKNLPEANLFLSVSYKGLGGDTLIKKDIFSNEILAIIPGGIGDAWDQIFDGKYHSVNAGITFKFPLKNYAAAADRMQAELKLSENDDQLNLTKLRIAAEIKSLHHSLSTIEAELKSASAYLEYAKAALEGIELKYAEGMATTMDLLRANRDVMEAEAYYRKALADKFINSCKLYLALGYSWDSLEKIIKDNIK